MAKLKAGSIKHLTIVVTNKGPNRKKVIELARLVIPENFLKNKDLKRQFSHPAIHGIKYVYETNKTASRGQANDLLNQIKEQVHKLETKKA